jgi:hypothetical protein
MGRTTALRQAIKQDFFPFLRDKGFVVDMRDAPRLYTFRKTHSDVVLECSVQWEKYGSPRFVLNFSKRGPQGLIMSGRLAPSQRRYTDGWFRQDRSWLEKLFSFSKLRPAEQVVMQLIAMFGEVEECWESQTIGPHVRLLPVPRPRAA